jgi:regulatory protein
VSGILEELRERGLVDDHRFAREFVRSKVELKGLGPHRLRWELGKFGIRGETAEAALEEAFPPGEEARIARTVVERRYGPPPYDRRTVRRASELLKRRGFSYDVVTELTFAWLEGAED